MGAEATIEIEQGKVWPSLSDMISQSKLVLKVGEVTKIKSYYWHPFMLSGTNTYIQQLGYL